MMLAYCKKMFFLLSLILFVVQAYPQTEKNTMKNQKPEIDKKWCKLSTVPNFVVGLDTASVEKFSMKKKYYAIPHFKIGGTYNFDDESSYENGGKGGKTLESLGLNPVQIGYIELGKPHRGPDGEIDNAILICPYYSGGSTDMLNFWGKEGTRTAFCGGSHIGPGKLFDTDKYYIILADALGLWGASKPSSSHPGKDTSYALGLDFPQYRLEDCVQLMYRLLKDKLKVNRLKLVTGVSMGATMTYAWGVLHPKYVERLMPIGGTPFQNIGMARWIFDLMTSAIQSDPIYRKTKGYYYHLPRMKRPIKGNIFGWSILKHSAFIDEFRVQQTFDEYKLEAFDWEKSQEVIDSLGQKPGYGQSLFVVSLMDSNDLIYRNRAQVMFNVEPELHRIKAQTLIIHISTDQWLPLHLAKKAHSKIKNSKLITFPHNKGHYAVFIAPSHFNTEIRNFMK